MMRSICGRPSTSGSVTMIRRDPRAALGRAEAQVLRIALIESLSVLGPHANGVVIERSALEAALAVWSYSRASVASLVGTSSGVPRADRLYRAILNTKSTGLAQSEMQKALGTHDLKAGEMDWLLDLLKRQGLVYSREEPTRGCSVRSGTPPDRSGRGP